MAVPDLPQHSYMKSTRPDLNISHGVRFAHINMEISHSLLKMSLQISGMNIWKEIYLENDDIISWGEKGTAETIEKTLDDVYSPQEAQVTWEGTLAQERTWHTYTNETRRT